MQRFHCNHLLFFLQTKLQTQLRHIRSEQATCTQQLESTKLSLETARVEKQIADGDLKSKTEEIQQKSAQVESLENEVKASKKVLEERLGEMTSKIEETQQLAQSKEEVKSFLKSRSCVLAM